MISFNACSVDVELIEDDTMGILLWLEQTLILWAVMILNYALGIIHSKSKSIDDFDHLEN